METGLLQAPHNRQRLQQNFYEYSVVAKANNEVMKKVVNEVENFCNDYGGKANINVQPQIAIATFIAKEAMEDTLIRYMHRICAGQQAFMVELNNYSGTPLLNIHLRVQNPAPFKLLARQLATIDDYMLSCGCAPVKAAAPHINIAVNLAQPVYLKALMNYGQRTFHEVFMVNELMLLRRSHDYDTEKIVNVFRLQPAPETLYN